MTTPSKVRRYDSSKLRTPGKTHRILCPETPASKVKRRKSDGNTSVAETPEKAEEVMTPRRQQASLAIRRRDSFYPGTLTRPDNVSVSLANTSNTMDLSAVLDESQMGVNKSLVIFPHLHNRRRKREDSVGVPPAGTGRSSPTPTTRASSGRPP